MSEKCEIYWRKKMLRLAAKLLKRADDVPNYCIDDFLDGMGGKGLGEEENCVKVKRLLMFLLSGIDERLEDIASEHIFATKNRIQG